MSDEEVRIPKGRGGWRPGAGRKPKGVLSGKAAAKTPMKMPSAKAIRDLEPLAIKTLEEIMARCPSDPPRVAAATAVLKYAREDAAAATTAVEGKKAARVAAAEEHMASGSRFAAPPPPGTLRQ